MKVTLTGLRAWLLQRLTAAYMIAFVIFVFPNFASGALRSYDLWRNWVMRPEIRIATFVFFTALLLHAWVGSRDVIMDYVHPLVFRMAAFTVAGFGLLAMEAWIALILLGS